MRPFAEAPDVVQKFKATALKHNSKKIPASYLHMCMAHMVVELIMLAPS